MNKSTFLSLMLVFGGKLFAEPCFLKNVNEIETEVEWRWIFQHKNLQYVKVCNQIPISIRRGEYLPYSVFYSGIVSNEEINYRIITYADIDKKVNIVGYRFEYKSSNDNEILILNSNINESEALILYRNYILPTVRCLSLNGVLNNYSVSMQERCFLSGKECGKIKESAESYSINNANIEFVEYGGGLLSFFVSNESKTAAKIKFELNGDKIRFRDINKVQR